MPHDRDLRERFAELRREDRAHAGEFSRLLHRARPRANAFPVSVWVAIAAGLVLAAAVVKWMPRLGHRTMGGAEISITEWKSSTDFLLRTPGREMLRTVPTIGELPASWGSIRGGRKSPAAKKNSVTKTTIEEDLS